LYAHHSGFFVKGFLSYLSSEKRIDLWGVGAGYRMNKGNLYWGIGGEFRIFNDSSYAIQSSVSAMAYTYLGYDLPWFFSLLIINLVFIQMLTDYGVLSDITVNTIPIKAQHKDRSKARVVTIPLLLLLNRLWKSQQNLSFCRSI